MRPCVRVALVRIVTAAEQSEGGMPGARARSRRAHSPLVPILLETAPVVAFVLVILRTAATQRRS